MAAIHIPDRRFRQPADIVGLHPDWEGRVVSLIHFGAGAPVDIVDRRANYVRAGSAIIEPARPGISGLRTGAGGTTTGYIESVGALAGWSGAPTLVFFLPEIGPTQDVGNGMLYAIPADTSYTQFGSTSTIYVLGNGSPVSIDPIFGTRNRTVISRATSSDPAVFVDYKKYAGRSGSISAGGKTVRIGAWSSIGYQFDGVFGSVAVIAGAITDDEAYQLVANPWLLYATEQEVMYSLPSGGALTLSSLTMSNLTPSGARATLGITR